MNRDISIKSIVDNKICNGCGTCTVICPTSAIKICFGKRMNYAVIEKARCLECGKCLNVCPSRFLLDGKLPEPVADNTDKGSVSSCLIYPTDKELRLNGSSGGFVSGLMVFLLENGFVDGCVVARCEGVTPLVAESFIARDRKAVLSAAGSKYTPVSNCIVIKEILDKPGRYVFVGTPCMLEGIARLEKYFPELKEYIWLKIGFVCAGMASRLSTKNFILNNSSIELRNIRKICYRGNGWPGSFTAYGENGEILFQRPYFGKDGSLKNLVACDHYMRCDNCFDHWSKHSDITVCDPWSPNMLESETEGKSAVMVRTGRGREIVGMISRREEFVLEPAPVEKMYAYNKHLLIDTGNSGSVRAWVFEVIFMRRLKYVFPLLVKLFTGKLSGVKTTLKAYLNKEYYY